MDKDELKERLKSLKRKPLKTYAERREMLLFELNRHAHEHRNCPDPRVSNLYAQTIEAIDENEIALPPRSQKEKIFGKISLLYFVQTVWGECVDRLFCEGSVWRAELLNLGGVVPPSKMLSIPNEIWLLERKLYRLVQNVREYPVHSKAEEDRFLSEAEVLRAISDFLMSLESFLPTNHLSWCEACFRRTENGRRYCREHKPANSGEMNTQNKRAARQREAFSIEMEFFWQQYKTVRRQLEKGAQLVMRLREIPNAVHEGGIQVPNEVSPLIFFTIHAPWDIIKVSWDVQLAQSETLMTLFQKKPSDFSEWKEFADYVMQVLNEPVEKNRHPYVIFFLLTIVEDFFKNQSSNGDQRFGTNKAKIIDMFFIEGLAVKEIKSRLGISPSRIHKVLQEYRSKDG